MKRPRRTPIPHLLGAALALAAAGSCHAEAEPGPLPLALPRWEGGATQASKPDRTDATDGTDRGTALEPGPDGEKRDGDPGEVAKKDGDKKPDDPPGGAKKDGDKPPAAKKALPRTPVTPPLGTAGPSTVAPKDVQQGEHFLPMPDRWRIGLPRIPRYPDGRGAPLKHSGGWFDPYNQNLLKGDYPIWGNDRFLSLELNSDTLFDFRRLYVPSGASAAGPGRYRFFGNGKQILVDQTFQFSAELFKGDTAFKPKDWAFRIAPAFNVNYLTARENGIADIDVRQGTSRTNLHGALQELFAEYKLRDVSRNYDFASVRAGIQGFNSDFRGFLFFDEAPGVRVFGNAMSNRLQYNLGYFRPLEKDTYSRLNTVFEDRQQDVFVANIYKQDLFRPGYTGQFTAAYNYDHPSTHFDANGVQVRPSLVGDAQPHAIHSWYLGWNGDGHLGRFNLTHSFYQALGYDTRNPIAGRRTSINAQMAAAEISYDKDWARFKASFFYASGDDKPLDGRARGFDAITDQPFFAGGPFSFFNSQGLGLAGTGIELFGDGSLLPSLRGSHLEGQSNFVNPGVMIFNVGTDLELTPKWKLFANINWIQFMKTQPLELVLNQSHINRSVGFDYSLGFRYRPWLNENATLFFGASLLQPGDGLRDIYQGRAVYSLFTKLNLTF